MVEGVLQQVQQGEGQRVWQLRQPGQQGGGRRGGGVAGQGRGREAERVRHQGQAGRGDWGGAALLYILLHLLHVSLELGASVLEPGDDLAARQAQGGGDLVPVGRGEVLLVQEPPLQLEYLVVGEGSAGLPLLLRHRVLPQLQLVCKVGGEN